MFDPSPLWDFDDPAASAERFRAAASAARGTSDGLAWTTQHARALGLQERFDEATALLDAVDAARSPDPQVRALAQLERGRVLRSSGRPSESVDLFDQAVETARAAGLDVLQVDALHMRAIVAPAQEQHAINQHALAVARASADERAQNWDASLLNNIGMTYADAGDHASALASFEEALVARERIGDDARTRVARWMVAWSLREVGRVDEALERQRALKAELLALGEDDPYVDSEIALLEESALPGD